MLSIFHQTKDKVKYGRINHTSIFACPAITRDTYIHVRSMSIHHLFTTIKHRRNFPCSDNLLPLHYATCCPYRAYLILYFTPCRSPPITNTLHTAHPLNANLQVTLNHKSLITLQMGRDDSHIQPHHVVQRRLSALYTSARYTPSAHHGCTKLLGRLLRYYACQLSKWL
jgi:hypothetical protein